MNIVAKFSGGIRCQNNTSNIRIFTAQRCGFPLSAKPTRVRSYHFFNGAKREIDPKPSNMSVAETRDNGIERDKKMNGKLEIYLT